MIDHLVYGVPHLAEAIDVLAQQTGVRPRFGGRHPGRGTHNALFSLGSRRYLEVIALDPEQPPGSDLQFPELRGLAAPAFLAWAISVADIDATRERLLAANLTPAGPFDGARARPDGGLLRWKTLRIAAPAVALAPFFISWDAATVHPSEDSPSGCRLVSVQIQHSEADSLRRLLAELAGAVTIAAGERPQLTARLATPNGQIELG